MRHYCLYKCHILYICLAFVCWSCTSTCCTGGAPYWLAIGHANEWIWTNLTWNLSSSGSVFLEKSWSSTLRSSWSQFFWPLIKWQKV